MKVQWQVSAMPLAYFPLGISTRIPKWKYGANKCFSLLVPIQNIHAI